MTSKSELEKMFKEAAKDYDETTPLKELTSSIINMVKRVQIIA